MLCRRWVVALQAGLLAFAMVALGTVLLPPTYQSTAKVLVESNRAQLLVSPGLQQDSPSQPSALIQSGQRAGPQLRSRVAQQSLT